MFAGWVGLVSGSAGVLLAVLGAMPTRWVPRWLPADRPLFWGVAAACVIVAMYRAWLAEHRARTLAESHPSSSSALTTAQLAIETLDAKTRDLEAQLRSKDEQLAAIAKSLAELDAKLATTSSAEEIKAQIEKAKREAVGTAMGWHMFLG